MMNELRVIKKLIIHGVATGVGLGIGLWIASQLSSMSFSITAVPDTEEEETEK